SFRSLPASLIDRAAEIYRPVAEKHMDKERDSRHLRSIARLKPGVTVAQAQSEMDLLTGRQEQLYPATNKNRATHVVTMQDDMVRTLRPALLVLQAAVLFVLLIACANIANLLLARSSARRREMAIRTALGASRAQVARQTLIESLLLSAIGG